LAREGNGVDRTLNTGIGGAMDALRRFRSTAEFYARYRPRYPQALIDEVAAFCGLDRAGRLMDLGCGPAFLAIAFAAYFSEIVGVDPEPEMLAAAQHEAQAAGVTLLRASSTDLGPQFGTFRMVTMGRSFHWMDRDATLRALDALIEPGGAIVLFDERGHRSAENPWSPIWDRVVGKWSPQEEWSAHMRRLSPDWERHEIVLARSAFSRLDLLTHRHRRRTTLDEFIGRVYSMSTSSIEKLGDNRAAFEEEFRAEMLALSPSGEFEEVVEANALIARRP
jgi:SAM-dependent methyltransferase